MTDAMGRLERRASVRRLLEGRRDLAVVSGLGSPTYDVAAAGDHPRNFYLWGAMGGAAMMGLGLALARPDLPVLVVTGDGEMLMGIGAFATIAQHAPGNLVIAILDNGLYGETGGQASHTSGGTDLAAVARASGIADARTLVAAEALPELAVRVHRIGNSPAVAVLKVSTDDLPRVLPSRDGAFLRARMTAALQE